MFALLFESHNNAVSVCVKIFHAHGNGVVYVNSNNSANVSTPERLRMLSAFTHALTNELVLTQNKYYCSPRAVGTSSISSALASTYRIFLCLYGAHAVAHTSVLQV